MALIPSARVVELRRALLGWFAENKRDLPWRRSASPYRVWVSEVMLQQTRVSVVEGYFARFMARFPTLEALAVAREEEVLGLWQGLGYYSRGRRLLEGARYVLREFGGQMPREPEELLKVPGIGPYSAGAIASIAHGVRAPLVDGNVIRVLTRVFGLAGDPQKKELQKKLWTLAGELVPADVPGEFNQALMELGALVCTPRSPTCLTCPWRKQCAAHAEGNPERYPEKLEKERSTEVTVLVLVLEHRAKLAFEALPASARWWAGLSALPSIELGDRTAGALSRGWAEHASTLESFTIDAAPSEPKLLAATKRILGSRGVASGDDTELRVLAPLRHQVTRFKITLLPVHVLLAGERPDLAGHVWVSRRELAEAALPAPHRKLVGALLAESRPTRGNRR